MMMHGIFFTSASSIVRVIFSPVAEPIEPPQNWKSITAIATGIPWIAPVPQITDSGRLLFLALRLRRSS